MMRGITTLGMRAGVAAQVGNTLSGRTPWASRHTRSLHPLRRTLVTHSAHAAIPFRTHIGTPTASGIKTPTAHTFFHKPTWTWTYAVACPSTRSAVVIDPVLDFDSNDYSISTMTADSILAFIREKGYTIEHILETHVHADHMTGAQHFKKTLEGAPPVGIGARVTQTQTFFAAKYDVPEAELTGTFDKLWKDDEEFMLGECRCRVMHLPGHTLDHVGYQFGNFVFVGDSIFLPTIGSARADFPFGSAERLFSSSQRLLSLPPATRLFSGHHYPGPDEQNSCSATVAEQREANKHLKHGTPEVDFVKMREDRDAGLAEPKLLYQSLQVNIRAGRLPRGQNGQYYLRLPVQSPPEF